MICINDHGIKDLYCVLPRPISVVIVVGPMNPYQPIQFHILYFAVFQSRILIYAGLNSRREKSIWEEYEYLVK